MRKGRKLNGHSQNKAIQEDFVHSHGTPVMNYTSKKMKAH